MKIILVTGMPDVDRLVLVDVAMKRMNMPKDKFDFLDLDNSTPILKSVITGKDLSLHQVKTMIDQMNDYFEKEIIKAMKNCDGVLVISSSLTINKDFGIFPVLKRDFFETFSPELIILVENKPIESVNKQKDMKLMEKQQDINEAYAFNYSAFSHAVVDRIIIKKGKLDDAVRHFTSSVKSIIAG